MDTCDECGISILSFGPSKENHITSSARKSDINIHPIYWEGFIIYNNTDKRHMEWKDKLWMFYNLALIKLQSSSIFEYKGFEPKKRQLNR